MHEEEGKAVEMMDIGFGGHTSQMGEPAPINADKYVLIVSKIFDLLAYQWYINVQ